MRRLRHRGWWEMVYIAVVLLVSLLLQWLVGWLPALMLAPIVLVYTLKEPLMALSIVAVFGELGSVLPPGVMLGVVFIPWILARLSRAVADVSFGFAALVVTTTFVQMFWLFMPDLWRIAAMPEGLWRAQAELARTMPLSLMIPAGLGVAAIAWMVSIAIHFNQMK